jgi:arsenite methyltransferase
MSVGEKTDRQVLDPETQRRFEALALPYLGHLYRLAVRLKRTTQDAEDLVQETYVKALLAFPALRDPERIRPWLCQILSRLVYDDYRSEPREVAVGDLAELDRFSLYDLIDQEDPFPYSDQLHRDFLARFDDGEVRRALLALPEAYRVPLVTMAYFTHAEARTIIRDTYAQIAPGSRTVAERLYAPEELDGLPKASVDLALGVGHPIRHAQLRPGDVVLDVGCGAGIDTLLAARLVGPGGHVIGLDMTPAMVERAREHAAIAGFGWVEIREGLMEAIPLGDSAVGVVVTNGALNLSTRKSRALAEMLRVLRPGGRLALADLVVTEALPEDVLRSAPAFAA